MIRAVIFDFDGVIADTMHDNFRAWKMAFNKYGLQMKEEEYFPLEGMGRFQIAQHFIEKYSLDPGIGRVVADDKEKIYQQINSFRIYDRVIEIIQLLKQKNIAMAIVTGASRERIMRDLGSEVSEHMQILITADDVKNTKPDPEPYLKAVKALAFMPEECLVIENAVLGIRSAKSAGCKCYALETTLKADQLNEADAVLCTHKDLLIKFETEI